MCTVCVCITSAVAHGDVTMQCSVCVYAHEVCMRHTPPSWHPNEGSKVCKMMLSKKFGHTIYTTGKPYTHVYTNILLKVKLVTKLMCVCNCVYTARLLRQYLPVKDRCTTHIQDETTYTCTLINSHMHGTIYTIPYYTAPTQLRTFSTSHTDSWHVQQLAVYKPTLHPLTTHTSHTHTTHTLR